MVKIVNRPGRRKVGDVVYYTSGGIEHARLAYNLTDYGKIPPTSLPPYGYTNQRQQQQITGQIRANLMRNLHRVRQTTGDRPDWHWNSGFSRLLWQAPFEDPEGITPPLWFKQRQPDRHWFDAATSLGIWHSWQLFDAFFRRALEWDLTSPAWDDFRLWQKQNCRYRWTAGNYLTPQNPSGIIEPKLMEAIVFAALNRGGYISGNLSDGLPPDWCQLARVPGGGWAAICYNAISDGCHCITCDKSGRRELCNENQFSAAIG